jgi:hypothetical protein
MWITRRPGYLYEDVPIRKGADGPQRKAANPIVHTAPPARLTAEALSMPTPLPATITATNREVGMGEDMKRSPGQWAPRIDDPDPPEDSLMTPEASKKATEGVAKLMTERREQLGQEKKRRR